MTLKDKAIQAVTWSLAGHIIQNISSFLIGIVLARLLSPPEYGLIGMATVFIFVTYVFIDSGFGAALIQRQNCTSADYSRVAAGSVVTHDVEAKSFYGGAPARLIKRRDI